jgi:hypothetical protein
MTSSIFVQYVRHAASVRRFENSCQLANTYWHAEVKLIDRGSTLPALAANVIVARIKL